MIDVPAFDRGELEEMVERWLDANKRAQQTNDWKVLADLFTPEATYGWNVGPKDEFMAVGRDEIRDIAVGMEMGGLDGWTYPYQKVIIDDRQGEVIGFWRQIADVQRADGSPYEVAGIGGSWFRYGGNWQWSWQRDFFDLGNVTSLFIEMMKDEVLSPGMKRRLDRVAKGERPPGHYPIGTAPVGLWE
jgi:SnoaL-like domain